MCIVMCLLNNCARIKTNYSDSRGVTESFVCSKDFEFYKIKRYYTKSG
jgi:hypothetical protein